MQEAQIYQIFYSEQTRQELDEGFMPLDNSDQRPDWYEYWPIRNYILRNEMKDDQHYGFLSPKFKAKTGLGSSEVHRFVAQTGDCADVLVFSPYYDASALFVNVFQQGANEHPGAWDLFEECARLVVPGLDLNTLIMDSTNSVFCNFFVARPRFWRHWFSKAEVIFDIAEQNATPLGRALNLNTRHNGSESAPLKVFFMERLAALILATESDWRVQTFNPMGLPLVYPGSGQFAQELVALDALKMAAVATGRPQYLNVFASLRNRVAEGMAKAC